LAPVKKKSPDPAATRPDKDAAAAPHPDAATPAAPGAAPESTDLAPVVGVNLRRLRTRRGLSLERLAQISGVSRAMLGQIELGQSAPTINVLWKIARALEVTFSALISARTQSGALVMRVADAKLLTSKDRTFTSRALFPFDEPRRVEFYELRLAAGTIEEADAHPPGTSENLVVTAGSLEIDVAGDTHRLEPGDSILFEADTPHTYRNPGKVETVMYLVMTYAEEIG
jgi:transcriptional regulator with XRE-family HTH domain